MSARMVLAGVIGLALGIAFGLSVSAAASERPPAGFRVIDGDTIAVMLPPRRGPDGTGIDPEPVEIKHRLAALDTPEKGWRALCLAERMLSEHATARVVALLNSAEVIEMRWTGRVGFHKRPITEVFVDGVSISEILISESLGQKWPKKIGWCE